MNKHLKQERPLYRTYPRGMMMRLLYLFSAALLVYLIAWVVWLQLLSLLIKPFLHERSHSHSSHAHIWGKSANANFLE